MCLNDQITRYCERFLVTLHRKGRNPATVAAWRRSLYRFYRYAQTQGVRDARYVPLDVLIVYLRVADCDGCSVAAAKDIRRLVEFARWIIRNRSGGFHPAFRDLSGRRKRGEATKRERVTAKPFRNREADIYGKNQRS